jgi:hypothetical protein
MMATDPDLNVATPAVHEMVDFAGGREEADPSQGVSAGLRRRERGRHAAVDKPNGVHVRPPKSIFVAR